MALLCAIASGGTAAATSDDNGITWTSRTLPSSATWRDIAWNGSVFCAIATGGTTAATSPDGITWTARTLPSSSAWNAIAWNGSVFCVISSTNGTTAATSPDGITWTARTLPVVATWQDIAWNGSVFCAIAASTTDAATSPDGITWTSRTLPAALGWRAIAWNGSVFCAVSTGTGDASATSPDGITWTSRAAPISGLGCLDLAWNGSVFFVTSSSSSTSAATSPDGITWTSRTLPSATIWRHVAWNGSVFCAVSSTTGTIAATSPDGITWTSRTLPASSDWFSVASGPALTVNVSGSPASSNSSVTGSPTSVKVVTGSLTSSESTVSGTVIWGSDVSGAVAASAAQTSGQLAASKTVQGSLQPGQPTASALVSVVKDTQGSLQVSPTSTSGVIATPRNISGSLQASSASASGSLDSFTAGTLSLSVTQDIFSSNTTLSFQIVQNIYSYGTLTATIESDITGYTAGTLSLLITQNITSGSGTLSLQITQSIVPPITPVVAGSGRWWTAKVYLDSVDVSPSLTAALTVDAEVNAARVATFTLKPTAGTVNPFAWVNKSVRIDYQETDSTGAVQATYTLFNGVVDTPLYNPTTRLTTFDCTDGMQKKFEAMSKTVIDGIIPGYWHEAVFDKDADSWSYALDLLSTIPYDMDINVIGNIILTPWLAKTTADYAFGMGNILDGSLSVSLANSRDLINDYEVSFDYRYELYRERGVRYSWYMAPGVMSADFVIYSPDMPFGQAFIDAVESAGLTFTQAPQLIPLPVSGNYLVYGLSGGAQVILWSNDNPDGIMGAQGQCSVRYSQTVTERRVSRVYSPQSVGQLSSIKSTLSASLEADYGDALDGYDETIELQESHANNANAVATSSSGNVIPYTIGGSVTTTYNSYANDYSALATTLDRETVYDFSSLIVSGDRTDADSAAEVLLNVASTDILNSHRRNTVSFTTLLCPYLDRIHTVRVDTDTVTAKGKVRQIVHSMDIDTGSALTECTLAISLASAVGIPASPPTLAPPTEGDVAPATVTDYASVVSLPTYVAGLSGTFDENMTGWIAQSDVASEGYSNSFVIPFDGVDDANLQEQEIQYEDEFEVIIPVDELLLEA